MEKDFDTWNFEKKKLDESEVSSQIYFREGDIWWCSLGINIGTESNGKGKEFRRPILVIKKLSADMCIALPLTSKKKKGSWFTEISFQGEKRCVLLYQIRMINKKRFQRKMGELDEKELAEVKEKLESLLELSCNHHPAEAGIDGNNPKSTNTIANDN